MCNLILKGGVYVNYQYANEVICINNLPKWRYYQMLWLNPLFDLIVQLDHFLWRQMFIFYMCQKYNGYHGSISSITLCTLDDSTTGPKLITTHHIKKIRRQSISVEGGLNLKKSDYHHLLIFPTTPVTCQQGFYWHLIPTEIDRVIN